MEPDSEVKSGFDERLEKVVESLESIISTLKKLVEKKSAQTEL